MSEFGQTTATNEPPVSVAGPGVQSGCGCSSTTNLAPPSFVYALGRIWPRFPTLAIEKEFAQAAGRTDRTGLTDDQAAHAVLSKPENRYLARKLSWLMTIEGLEAYILIPNYAADLDLLIDSLRRDPGRSDVNVVIGVRGPTAPPSTCNGLQVPIVGFDQIYSFDVDTLINAIPRPDSIPAERFSAVARELFMRIMQLADNAGSTDEHRALNYLAVRYPAIYATSAEAQGRNAWLTDVGVRPSPLSGVRRIWDVIFSFTQRTTDVTEKYFVRVDTTEEFPFLVTKMSPYYDR